MRTRSSRRSSLARALGVLLAAGLTGAPVAAADSASVPGGAVPRSRLLQAAPGRRLTPPDPTSKPEQVARAFVRRQLAPAGSLAPLSVVEGGGGVRFVTFEQRFDGLPVHLGRVTVAVDPDGSVLAARVGELAPAGPPPLGSRALLRDAAAARAHALAARGWSKDARPRHLRHDVPAVATLVPAVSGSVRAWSVRIAPPEDPHAAEEVLLAADDGRELGRFDVHFDAVDGARAWPSGPAAPSAWVTFPDPVSNPSAHSPLGWVDDRETLGNNVHAFLDRTGRLDPALGQTTVATGDPPVFDFPFTGDPVVDTDAAVTNVFWALNFAHDRFRLIGFDEASGAMQDDNYGRGGVPGDRVHAAVQYRSEDGTVATNRIQMSTARDGTFASLVVGLFTDRGSGVTRDAAFETDLLVHEYAHGVTARMIEQDPACLGGQQSAALAEGWSDFFAASFTDDPVLGAWLADDAISGQRTFALDVSPLSYLNYCGGGDGCNAIRDGEIWSATLWDIRELFVAERGADGVEDAERLVLEALRYTVCRPTYLDARDGVLLADEALFGGEHWCALWQVFAGRGLGADATTTGPDDRLPFAGFAPAGPCAGTTSIAFDQPEYGLEADALVEVGDAAPPPGATVRVQSSSGDVETVLLETVPGGPRLRAGMILAPGAPAPEDGLLQVTDGDTLTATYDPTGISSTAGVTGDLPVSYLIHYVLASNCQSEPDDDHADAPGWFLLPGFLDAGETADIILGYRSASAAPLLETEVTVESLHPNVTILPTAAVPLGTIAAARPGDEPLLVFTVQATASTAVVPGEEAELRLRFSARGRSSERSLRLVLDMDYVVEEDVSPFFRAEETFDADSPTRALWTHRANRAGPDGWLLADCAGAGGTPGYGNTNGRCLGYPDDQGAPVLLSPPLLADLPAEAVAWRYRGLAWQNDVQLWVEPRAADLGCDADLVAAFLTDDPDVLPYDDPLGVLFAGVGDPIEAWIFANNTDGFALTEIPLPTGEQPVDPAVAYDQLRLAFVFWSDIIDETVEPRCQETANEGNFLLDNVVFRYDYVRVVPEATPCDGGCAVLLDVVAEPPGPKCADEPFVLDASATEVTGCAGELVYSFVGPGIPPEYALTAASTAPALGADDGRYTVVARCDTDPDCAAALTLGNVAPEVPGLGGPFAGTLRARRDGDDVLLSWIGAAGPPAYGAWRGVSRADLETGVATWPLIGSTDDEGPAGEGAIRLGGAVLEPGLAHYQVLARDLCTDEPILP